MKKIYILTIVSLEADGCLSFDTLKYNTRDEAQSYGDKLFDEWVSEHCECDSIRLWCGSTFHLQHC